MGEENETLASTVSRLFSKIVWKNNEFGNPKNLSETVIKVVDEVGIFSSGLDFTGMRRKRLTPDCQSRTFFVALQRKFAIFQGSVVMCENFLYLCKAEIRTLCKVQECNVGYKN